MLYCLLNLKPSALRARRVTFSYQDRDVLAPTGYYYEPEYKVGVNGFATADAIGEGFP